MAGIQVGSAHGKRPVDHEIPLVPFIDLLLCCVMFLLVTAVWNRLAVVETPLDAAGDPTAAVPPTEHETLSVYVHAEGFVLASPMGDRLEIARDDGLAALRTALRARRGVAASDTELEVIADDGVLYAEVIATMDAAVSSGFLRVGVRDRG